MKNIIFILVIAILIFVIVKQNKEIKEIKKIPGANLLNQVKEIAASSGVSQNMKK